MGFLVSDISRLMRRAFSQRLESFDLSLMEARALYHAARNEGLRQIDFAAPLEVQPIAVARLIDRLESLGLVERRPAPDDRRAYLIYVLPAAQPVLERLEEESAHLRQDMTKGLSRSEIAALTEALIHVRSNLHRIHQKPARESVDE